MNRRTIRLGIVCALIACAAPIRAQSSREFTSAPSFTWPTIAREIEMGDVTGSTRPDIVAISRDNFEVYLRDLDLGTTTTIALPVRPLALLITDVTGDGDQDIVVTGGTQELSGPAEVDVLERTPTGFVMTTFPVSFAARVNAADMDQDGDRDLVCGLTILRNDGALSPLVQLAEIPQTTGGLNRHWQPGDFDGDGDMDLMSKGAGNVNGVIGEYRRVYRHNASGTWTLLNPFMVVLSAPSSVVADFDSDGAADVFTSGGDTLAGFVRSYGYVIRGGASLPMTPSSVFTALELAAWTTAETRAVDIDLDGDLDIVHGTRKRAPFAYFNDGLASFTPADKLTPMPTPPGEVVFVATGDEDLDGLPDIVAGVDFSNTNFGGADYVNRFHNNGPIAAGHLPSIAAAPVTFLYYSTQQSHIGFLVTNFDGTPCPGQLASFQVIPGTSTGNLGTTLEATSSISTAYGSVAEVVEAPISTFAQQTGQFQVTATLRNGGASATATVYVVNPLEIIAGEGEGGVAGTEFPVQPTIQNLVFGVNHPTIPVPSPGQSITWTVVSGSVSFIAANGTLTNTMQTTTNVNGLVSVRVKAGATVGPAVIQAGTNSIGWRMINLTVLPPAVNTFTQGDGQATNMGQPFADPVTIRVVDPLGTPQANATVSFFAAPLGTTLSAPSVQTNASGEASVFVTPPAGYRGSVLVHCTTPTGFSDAHLFVRGIVALHPNPSSLNLQYLHEHAGIPLIVMADVPLPAPGYVASPFGNLYTSVYAPLPTFAVLDGWGAFGPPDYTVITGTSGSWVRAFSGLPPLGMTFVVQVAAYDPAYPYPASIVLSNAATFTL